MINHYKKSLPMFELGVNKMLDEQCMDKNNIYYGAMENVMDGYTEPTNGCGVSSTYIIAYYTPGIKHYRSEEILFRAKIAMEETLNRQHEDGTLDLMTTNFHDSTVCGFAMQWVGPAYQVMQKFTQHTEEENEIDGLYRTFIKNCGEAMTNLGFHTPNHRWVVSSALAFCYNIIGDPRYLNHIEKFIAEGIDCDENGEYTERSAGIYNAICNRSLIIMAQQLNKPELLEYVSRNLNMSLKYLEPDDTVNSMNSNRQDSDADSDFDVNYDCYANMAFITGNPEFAWIADYMLEKNLGRFAANPNTGFGFSPAPFLTDETLEAKMLSIETRKPPLDYDIYFKESGIVRKRSGDVTLTLVKDRAKFVKLQYKDKRMYVRFAGSFFGPHAQFVPQTIEPVDPIKSIQPVESIDGGYRLEYHAICGYKRPFENYRGTSDWRKMEHSKREDVCMQNFDVVFEVKLTSGELEIAVKAGGCENIPLKLELMFDAGGVYSTPDTEIISREGDYIFLKKGSASYTFSDKKRFIIDIESEGESGFNSHRYAKDMRGSIPGDGKACSIVMTGFTPLEKTVKIRWGGMNLR